MAKRNISYIKPQDPEFIRVLKKQAGYDDRNHKFDELQNAEEDFVDDADSELPQVVVLNPGDLTAEEADLEKKRIEKQESETKADLTKKIYFKSKKPPNSKEDKKRKQTDKSEQAKNKKKALLSFDIDEEEDNLS